MTTDKALRAILANAGEARTTYQDGAWRMALIWRSAENRRNTTFIDPLALLSANEALARDNAAFRAALECQPISGSTSVDYCAAFANGAVAMKNTILQALEPSHDQ